MRRAAIVLGVAALVPTSAGPSWACSCAAVSPKEHARMADVIFAGSAVSVTTGPDLGGVDEARFWVDVAYKGPVEARMTVVTPSDEAACGFTFAEGGRYTVFAFAEDGPLSTNLCTATTLGDIAENRFSLSPRDIPPPDDAGQGPVAPGARDRRPLAMLAAVLAFAGAAAALGLRRRAT